MPVTLEDKYTTQEGRIYITGLQAFVRLPLMQKWADEKLGLKTAGFISGYRGSPLGTYDMLLWQAKDHLKKNSINFVPGINEDLGATAVWGSQQSNLAAAGTYQGVFGLWYGKGPGVDRSGDVLKHANAAGTMPHGGVLAIAGDDHACKSSTLPHQSDFAFMDAGIPLLYPANVQEVLDYGLYGWAMSRFSGCWVGLKALSDTMDASASVFVGPERTPIILPKSFQIPEDGLSIRWPDKPADQEARLYQYKIPAAQAFVHINGLDHTIAKDKNATFGIVTSGKSYIDTLQAFTILGLTLETAKKAGIALYKVAMPWPLEPEGIKNFTTGLQEVLVIEEKRPFVEMQMRDILYSLPQDRRPSIIGKKDEKGQSLLPSTMDLTPEKIAIALAERLKLNCPHIKLAPLINKNGSLTSIRQRAPFYCSGCPHNISTKVPDGSTALGGIGCHYMATWIYDGTMTFAQMGGEGVPWIGQASFTKTPHVFANLGDGTYSHSGILAIRATVAANVNITYKILYNDAVAMTGGQPVEGNLSVPQITQQLAAEGVQKIAVVTDDLQKYPIGSSFAPKVVFFHRDDLDKVQKDFREMPGVTAIVYDQTCAAESRRRRKRGLAFDPPKRLFINTAVCEGCGDCSAQSNCLSILPKETPFGTKREIDQTSCNKDYSCVKGFCPSFIDVMDGTLKKLPGISSTQQVMHLPEPTVASCDQPYNIYVAGVGGTGIVTIGALIAMAAHIEGKGCSTVDMIGLAQKGGAVVSHVKIASSPEKIDAVRISPGATNLLFGCDIIVSSLFDTLTTCASEKTVGLINTSHSITGDFVQHSEVYTFPATVMEKSIKEALHVSDFFNISDLVKKLTGDSVGANIFMLGYCYQKGWLPLNEASIKQAITLNNITVEKNLDIFDWGRKTAHDADAIWKLIETEKPAPHHETLEDIITRQAKHLTAYQNAALAEKYIAMVEKFQKIDKTGVLAGIVAKNYSKLLAYKDEYEVARLYTSPAFLKELNQTFGHYKKIRLNLAPPILSKRDPHTGHLQKSSYGSWILTVFAWLKKFKFLRGTPFDIFGYMHERQLERGLIKIYETQMEMVLKTLTKENYKWALELLDLPDGVRGFGHVKEKNIALYHQKSVAIKKKFLFL